MWAEQISKRSWLCKGSARRARRSAKRDARRLRRRLERKDPENALPRVTKWWAD